MPIDIKDLVKPSQTAVLAIECMETVLGEGTMLPGLRQSVIDSGMLQRLATLLGCARAVGAHVIHCTVQRNPNSRVSSGMRSFQSGAPGGDPGRAQSLPPAGTIVPALTPHPSDLVSQRGYGMAPFYESGLDDELRRMGVKTVITTGVSLNIAITGTTIEAVNRGYNVVLPVDCAASDPPEYAEWLIRYTLRNMAVLTTAEGVATAWEVPWTGN